MNPRFPSLAAAILLAATPAVHAVRQAPGPAPEPPKKDKETKLELPKSDEPVPPYELKNRSTFANAVNISRAPFWPIGYVKRAKSGPVVAAAVEAPKVTIDASHFKVTSILLGSGTTPSLAVINARAYSEGEFIRFPKTAGTTAPRIRVQRINDGSIILQNGDQPIVVPLQRPELNPTKPETLLDDKDR
jgi:hypothetical protein